VAISRDGRLVASFHRGGTVMLWDAVDSEVRHKFIPGKPVQSVGPWSGAVNGLAFQPEGRRLTAAAADLRVRLWDTATGRPLLDFSGGSNGAVPSLAFSPDGRRIASASSDRTVKLWEPALTPPLRAP
jgi:WD40 repeat protein